MRRIYLFGLGLAAMAVLGGVAVTLSDPPWRAGRQKLVLAESRQIMSALIHVAAADGLFEEQGLDVEIMRVSNGAVAMERLLSAKVDLALASDVPTARAILDDQPMSVLATVQTSDRDIVIASPAGSGLLRAEDLIGKRIGYIPGANSEHFLDLLLRQTGLEGRVERVPFQPDTLMAAMASGQIDAASAWTTIRINAAALFPSGFDTIAMPGLYTGSWVLSVRRDVVTGNRETVVGFLKALLAAEQVILHDPQHAIAVVASATGIDAEQVAKHWSIYGFTLRLDQALLMSFDSQIRLAGRNPGSELLDYMATDVLQAADPSRVTILR